METYYFPTDDIRNYRTADIVYRKDYPMVGYVPVTIIPHTHYSYWGEDSVSESNNLALLRDYGEELITIRYADGDSLGYVGRAYDGYDIDMHILKEIAAVLMDYPLYDESHHSEYVMGQQEEYINRDGVVDFHIDTNDRWKHEDDETIVSAIWQALSDCPYGGGWDGSGYRVWDDNVSAAEDILASAYLKPNIMPGQLSLTLGI